MHLAHKVVILTGASHGIGRAAATKFVEAGCQVVLIARSEARLAQLAATLGSEHTLAIPADVSQSGAGQAILEKAIDHFGRVDILVNNAAIGLYGPSATASIADIQTVLAVNFLGPLQLTQACVPLMQTQGGGLIINLSSIVGRRSTPWNGAYCASKAALEHMVESLRVELAPQNIRFSTLYPGVTKTAFVQHALGPTAQRQGRVQGVSPERVATKLIRVAQKEPRDAYVTLFDWAFVVGSRLFPGLIDRLFRRYFFTRQ